VAEADVAVLGLLGDDRVLVAPPGRLAVGETHQGEVDAFSRLRHDHPRAGNRRADPERPRRVAGDDARLAADDWVDARVSWSEVITMA